MGTVTRQELVRTRDRFVVAAILALALPSIALADDPIVTVDVPPGGTSRLIVVPPLVPNEPTPIIIDGIGPDLGMVTVTQLGAEEAGGAALIDGGSVIIRTVSSAATTDLVSDPMIAVTVSVSDQATEAATVNVSLGASALLPSGSSQATLVGQVDSVVNGSVSIAGISPGGGLLPAGSLVALLGSGFQPGAQVLIDGV